MQTMSDAE